VVLDIVILNPEKTILTYRLASLGARIFAHVIDLMVCGALITGIDMLAARLLGFIEPGLAVAIISVISVLGWFAYFILLEGLWNGLTVGKKILGTRVRMADGTPVTFAAAMGRNLLRPGDFLPVAYLVGLAAMFTNPRSQRLGDLVANTIVVYEKKNAQIYAPAPHTAGIHPLEQSVGELPGMTIEEYTALRRYCDRFPELPQDVQDKLTSEVWEPIAERRKVPTLPNVHPIYLAEAAVMKYGRKNGLL
jgi:uncharacterized RDD family membrane protein YckC